MTIYPCHWCHRKASCEIRREKIKSVRGLKLTVIRFTCKIPERDFPPGTRVVANVVDRGTHQLCPLHGTVMKHLKRGVLVAVDAEWKEAFLGDRDEPDNPDPEMGDVIRVHAERLEKLPETGVRVCARCGCPENRDDLRCRNGELWSVCENCEMLSVPEVSR